VTVRIADETVQVALVQGQPMEIRVAATGHKLTPGKPLQVSA
jgi:hypothetical protein